MPKEKKVADYSCLSGEKVKKLKDLTREERIKILDGKGQGKKLECAPTYEKGGCEEVLRSKSGNAFIVLGRDRPNGIWSGYGGTKDHPAASAVRITAGMGGRSPKEEILLDDGKRIKNPLDPNNQQDAATIYLSQKTDIDHKQHGFNLASGTIGHITGRSAVAMKADSVRLISRDGGIKLIAGGSSKNSQGGDIVSYPDINFIAGNDDSGRLLQPLVKGENMKAAIKKIYKFMDQILETVNSILLEQDALNKVLMTHVHSVPPIQIPTMKLTGFVDGGNAGGPFRAFITDGNTIPPSPLQVGNTTGLPGFTGDSPGVLSQAGICTANHGSISVDKIVKMKANMVSAKHNATLPTSPNYIMSKNVFTT